MGFEIADFRSLDLNPRLHMNIFTLRNDWFLPCVQEGNIVSRIVVQRLSVNVLSYVFIQSFGRRSNSTEGATTDLQLIKISDHLFRTRNLSATIVERIFLLNNLLSEGKACFIALCQLWHTQSTKTLKMYRKKRENLSP